MMPDSILYYPHIEFQNEAWVKSSLLLWNHVYRIVPDDWCALFMGQAKPFTMKWIGKQAHLRYLFKLMIQKKYITFDRKSAGQWEILGSHFLNAQGKPFTDWDSQHDPIRGAKILERFAEVLNIHGDPPRIETLTDEINEELKEFDDWEEWKG